MGDHTIRQDAAIRYDTSSWLITAIGALLGTLGFAYIVTHPEPISVWAIELALVSLPAAAIVYGGYWIASHQVPKAGRWRIAKWCVIGAAAATALLFGYIVAELANGEPIIAPGMLVILGALSGAFIALFAAISNERHHLTTPVGRGDERRLITAGVEPFSPTARTFATLVQQSRSWYVVRAVQLAETPLGVESITEQIAAVEATDPRTVYLDLAHSRLPKLDDDGLIRYDAEVGIVQTGDQISSMATVGDELSAAAELLTEDGD